VSHPTARPSDLDPDVLAAGRTDVTTMFVAMSSRDPGGRDAEYLAWHALDHRPEIHRLDGLRGAQRLVSTPACRAARAAEQPPFDGVDHVMAYLFAGPAGLAALGPLAGALGAAGRMPFRLPSVELATYDLAGTAAAGRVLAGADVIPWRPCRGAYLLVERGGAPADELTDVPGVAGAWWFRRATTDAGGPDEADHPDEGDGGEDGGGSSCVRQITWCYLDDDPPATAARLDAALERRWAGGAVAPLLAGPFHVPVPFDWERHLP
jgi:hypothetical protein